MLRPGRLTSTPLARRSPRSRRWLAVVALVGVVAWAWVTVAGDGGWLELHRQRRRLGELEADVARLNAENDSLRRVLWRLQNDTAYVEKVAREEYGMVREGERLYRIQRADAAE